MNISKNGHLTPLWLILTKIKVEMVEKKITKLTISLNTLPFQSQMGYIRWLKLCLMSQWYQAAGLIYIIYCIPN